MAADKHMPKEQGEVETVTDLCNTLTWSHEKYISLTSFFKAIFTTVGRKIWLIHGQRLRSWLQTGVSALWSTHLCCACVQHVVMVTEFSSILLADVFNNSFCYGCNVQTWVKREPCKNYHEFKLDTNWISDSSCWSYCLLLMILISLFTSTLSE